MIEYLNEIAPKKRKHNPTWTDKLYDQMLLIRETICPGFELTPEIDEIYQRGFKYFHSDETCGLDLNKGLYVYGVFGVGKTMFFKVMLAYLHSINKGFRYTTSDQLCSNFSISGFEAIEEYSVVHQKMLDNASPCNLFIDDVGQGANDVRHFGTTTNVIVEILQRRYRCFTDAGLMTHISTNLEPKEIKEVFGQYIYSRAKEMFNPILFPGSDKRK